MRYDHIVWDFNGTILDDVQCGIAATNILLRRRGIPEIDSLDTYYRVFGFPIEEYYVRIGFDFTREAYADVALEWAVEYKRLSCTAPLRPGIRPLLDAIATAAIPQSVLSASEEGLLREQLAALSILPFFADVRGRGDAHGSDKIALARAFREDHPGRILFIGDTDHDAACARAAGFDCALLAGGHQGAERLAACGFPVYADAATLHAHLCDEGSL